MPYPNEHAARITDPKLYDSFARKNITKGIDIILGIKDGKSETQAYRFKKDIFTPEQAQNWLKENKIDAISFEPATENTEEMEEDYLVDEVKIKKEDDECKIEMEGCKDKKTFSFKKEVFATGIHNGVNITDKILEDLEKNFSELKSKLDIPVKLGHSENQQLLQDDGLPAAGWITGLNKKGNKLVATFSNIPKKINQLMENKAYKNVSIEFAPRWTDKITGKKYNNVLKAIALMGVDTPAVGKSYLDDFVKLYNDEKTETVNFNYEITNSEKEETQEMEDLKFKEQLDKQNEIIKLKEEEIKKFNEEKISLEKQLSEQKAISDKLLNEQRDAEVLKFIDENSTEENFHILPKHKDLIKFILLNSENEKLKFSETEEISLNDAIKKLISDMPNLVKFNESAMNEQVKEEEIKNKDLVNVTSDENDRDKTFAEINAIADKDGISFTEAFQKFQNK